MLDSNYWQRSKAEYGRIARSSQDSEIRAAASILELACGVIGALPAGVMEKLSDEWDRPVEAQALVNLEWITVDEPGYLGPGMRYQAYESAPYETWERGGAPFATLAEVAVFLREQSVIHQKVAWQYNEAAQLVEAKNA